MLIIKCIGFRVFDECYAHARLIKSCKRVYACSYHWILLIIKVEEGTVEVLDSLLKKESDFAILKGIVDR